MRKRLLPILLVSIFLTTACGSKKDIMRAEDWKDKYPGIYASYRRNAEMKRTKYGGSEPIDYLVEHPNLRIFYDGYGFSEGYSRARGHVYALEDVIGTPRPRPNSSCLACKTADFTELLNKEGIGVNIMDFDKFVEENGEMEGVSCYDCHRNEPGITHVTREHFNVGLEHIDQTKVKPQDMACGQCHLEYYLDPDTKEVILPWHNGLGTDGMIEYYDNIGFSDWEHPTTGSPLLKAQHPEFETFYSDSIHHNLGVSCMDCHMPEMVNDKGDILPSHQWTSPLLNIEAASCFTCHTNETGDSIITRVEDVQGKVTSKTNEVSDIILELIQELTKAVETNSHSEDVIKEVRDLHRKAQFKWDFVFVENGEGFHNSALAHKNLDEALDLAKKGLDLLR